MRFSYRFWHLPSNDVNVKSVLRYLALLFRCNKLKNLIYLKRRELAHKCVGMFCRFWHLSSNGVNAKLVLRHLDVFLKLDRWRRSVLRFLNRSRSVVWRWGNRAAYRYHRGGHDIFSLPHCKWKNGGDVDSISPNWRRALNTADAGDLDGMKTAKRSAAVRRSPAADDRGERAGASTDT